MRVSSSLDWSQLKRPIKESKPRGAVKITEAQKTAVYSLDLEKTKKCIFKKEKNRIWRNMHICMQNFTLCN